MNAAERLRRDGFTLALDDAGRLSITPAGSLNDSIRDYIRAHLGEIKAALRHPANEPPPRCRAWRIRFRDGSGATAVNTTGADHDEMLLIVREQFGAGRVAGVEPAG